MMLTLKHDILFSIAHVAFHAATLVACNQFNCNQYNFNRAELVFDVLAKICRGQHYVKHYIKHM